MKRLICVLFCSGAWAETFTIADAVRQAQTKYPSLRVSAAKVEEAAAAVNLARTAFLPKVDGVAQINRATRNNVYGMLLPPVAIAPISGPPNHNNSLTSVWGTSVGFLVSWEPFDFGLRKAGVDAAAASTRRAEVAVDRAKLDVSAAAADAFLTILAAQQTVAGAKAGIARAKTFLEVVTALANAGLRPGAEVARARAELALAENSRIQAEQSVALARASLGQFVAVEPGSIDVAAETILKRTPGAAPAVAAVSHPALREQAAAIEESKARRKVLDASYYPKFAAQGALYARGTGANPDFTTGGAAAGLGPNIHNWGMGFTVSLPVMDYASLRVRKQIESAREKTETAQLDVLRAELNTRAEKAKAMLATSLEIVATIPVQKEAARAAVEQSAARYKAGLGTIAEVAEAQRLLTQTEIDESLARLGVWRAQLALASAQGDLEPFLASAK